jgi:hypothetical protein
MMPEYCPLPSNYEVPDMASRGRCTPECAWWLDDPGACAVWTIARAARVATIGMGEWAKTARELAGAFKELRPALEALATKDGING